MRRSCLTSTLLEGGDGSSRGHREERTEKEVERFQERERDKGERESGKGKRTKGRGKVLPE